MSTQPNSPKRPTLTAQLMKEQAAHNLACTQHAEECAAFAVKLAALEAELAPQRAAIAAKSAAPAHCTCTKCSGTGRYNNEPGSVCFRCEGKGYQLESDRRRNWGYDTNARVARPAAAKQHTPTAQAATRADAVKAFFAANPDARSVTPEQLAAFKQPATTTAYAYPEDYEDGAEGEYDMAASENWS